MNVPRLLKLASVIREQPYLTKQQGDRNFENEDPRLFQRPLGFNMRDWHCGTTGCLAGWAVALWGKEVPPWPMGGGVFAEDIACWAGRILGFDVFDATEEYAARCLFAPADYGAEFNYKNISPSTAADVLEEIAKLKDGEVYGSTIIDIWQRVYADSDDW